MANKKTTKSAEPKSPKKTSRKVKGSEAPRPESTPQAAQVPVELQHAPQELALAEKFEADLDKQAEHRMQAESPLLPEDAEAEAEALAADTFEDAAESDSHQSAAADAEEDDDETEPDDDEGELEDEEDEEDEEQPTLKSRPPAKLERLQKILAQAGVASRRRGEDLIAQGRVQVNGKIVTELGTKADAARDHIRV